ncbi:MAG TPA: hypothetical protein VGO80_06105 [Solirubrobacteraceae bacterium]|nr:hypothetical protein [Solirubrobacteraceae bacterium]
MPLSVEEILTRLNAHVEHRRGIRVVAGGVLNEMLEGRPAGTPFVVLEVRTLHDAAVAEASFGEISGRSELAWEHGWGEPPAPHAAAGWLLALKLFVDADRFGALDDDATP